MNWKESKSVSSDWIILKSDLGIRLGRTSRVNELDRLGFWWRFYKQNKFPGNEVLWKAKYLEKDGEIKDNGPKCYLLVLHLKGDSHPFKSEAQKKHIVTAHSKPSKDPVSTLALITCANWIFNGRKLNYPHSIKCKFKIQKNFLKKMKTKAEEKIGLRRSWSIERPRERIIKGDPWEGLSKDATWRREKRKRRGKWNSQVKEEGEEQGLGKVGREWPIPHLIPQATCVALL